jgi:hypothetical protein
MNGTAHMLGGAIGGPIAGAALSVQANRQPTFAEVCGWLAAGIGGAKLPDLLEPAYCPRHLVLLQSKFLQDCIETLRNNAEEHHRLAQSDPNGPGLHRVWAYLLEFLAGVLPGLLGGYASHLILDSTTPCGLPLV